MLKNIFKSKKDKKVGSKSKKAAEPQLFYASKDKLARAKKLAATPSDVRAEYEKLSGSFNIGYGVEPVE